MPLGIVSDKDFINELQNSHIEVISRKESVDTDTNNTSPVVISDVLDLPTPGRHNEVTNIPQSLRKILGEEVATNGLRSAMQLADSLGSPNGISQPTLSSYARGEISPGKISHKANDLTEYINGRKTKITKRAMNKLNLAISLLDENKLLGCDANELTNVAKGMAQVVKQMEPSQSEDKKSEPVQFHFYAPQVRQENHYETVLAKDNY